MITFTLLLGNNIQIYYYLLLYKLIYSHPRFLQYMHAISPNVLEQYYLQYSDM